MNNNNANNHQTIMSSAVLSIPLLTMIAIAVLSLVWHDNTFTISRLSDFTLVGIHAVIVVALFTGYFVVINNARKAITALTLKQKESAEELDSQKRLLHLETYQHQKTSTELYELRTQDPLTKLYNHAYFKELLDNEVERTKRYSSEFSLLIIELDNFIRINDRFGNDFGTFAIKKYAQLIQRRLRKSDLLTRYDRHNLAIIAPNTGLQASKLFANRLCNDIEVTKVLFEGVQLDITLSIGVGIPSAVNELTSENLTWLTEQALRTATKQGGNQIVDVLSFVK